METLRTKLDGLQWEVNRLQAENLKLKEANPESAKWIDGEAELKELHQTLETTKATYSEALETVHSLHEEKEQLESKLVELQAELADQQIQTELLMQQLQESQMKLKYAETEAKLQCYEAVDIERKKWELREERLLDEVATLKKRKEPVNLGITQKRQLPKLPEQSSFMEDGVREQRSEGARTPSTSLETRLSVTSGVSSGNSWGDKTVGSHLVSSPGTTLSRSGTHMSREFQLPVVLPESTLTSSTSKSFFTSSRASTDVVLSSPWSGNVTTLKSSSSSSSSSSTQGLMVSMATPLWDPTLVWTTSMLGQQDSSVSSGYATTWSTGDTTITPLLLQRPQVATGLPHGPTTNTGMSSPPWGPVFTGQQSFSLSTTSDRGLYQQ